jgi:5-formyltetrahydrofolate cyclo-ligase
MAELAVELSKIEARRTLKARLKTIPGERFLREGRGAAGILIQSPLWKKVTTLLLFLSLKREIDTAPLLEAAFREGKRIFLPRVEGDTLNFCRLENPAGPWAAGPLGTREPLPGTAELRPGDFPALVITPGLGFTPEGIRLGRGRGYYDRFFASLDRGILAAPDPLPGPPLPYFALGLCLDCQILEGLPSDNRDKIMDALCTGTGLVMIKGRGYTDEGGFRHGGESGS